jgi:hypothetical protein
VAPLAEARSNQSAGVSKRLQPKGTKEKAAARETTVENSLPWLIVEVEVEQICRGSQKVCVSLEGKVGATLGALGAERPRPHSIESGDPASEPGKILKAMQ